MSVFVLLFVFFFFKQKTAYEMRISDWSSDVCSSDLWPIPPDIAERLPGQRIDAVRRRAKYLLLDTAAGSALLHLGMSGSLRVLPADAPVRVHDHFDIALAGSGRGGGRVLRFNDPRRFGCLLWQPSGEMHPLLRGLGPEPSGGDGAAFRSEEHTSELQSLTRISYAVFCLEKNTSHPPAPRAVAHAPNQKTHTNKKL